MRRSLEEIVIQLQNLADEAQMKGHEQACVEIERAIENIKAFEGVLE